MYKVFAASSTAELAHQKALTTRDAWLRRTSYASELSRIHSWDSFEERYSMHSEDAIARSRRRLLDDLAKLAEGTIVMGRPKRDPTKFGPIASPESKFTNKVPPQLHDPPSPMPRAKYNIAHIMAPVPITPIRLLNRSFEVRTSTTTLSEPLSFFYDSFDEDCSESPDESVCDENAPPLKLFKEELGTIDIDIPVPQLRGRRKPFAVLHFDPEGAPSEGSDKEGPVINNLANDLEGACGNRKVVDVFYESGDVVSGCSSEGEDQLHLKASGTLGLNYKKEEQVRIPPAPKMTNIPLPLDISPSCASISPKLEDVAILVSQKRLSQQKICSRESLLTILNKGTIKPR